MGPLYFGHNGVSGLTVTNLLEITASEFDLRWVYREFTSHLII